MKLGSAGLMVLLVAVALAGCTSSGDDADGDTMPRREEIAGWQVVVHYMTNRTVYHVDSDPEMFDTDGDGVSDFDEFFRGLDPRKVDTDEDGLTDCQEVFHSNRTECEDSGFHDEDGGTGTDPLRADSDAGRGRYAFQYLGFTDAQTGEPANPGSGDGISDGEELAGVHVRLQTGRERVVILDPLSSDTDGDRLDDGAEVYIAGSDPTVADTDGDGCMDGLDPYPGRLDAYTAGLRSFELKKERSGGGGDILIRLNVVDHDQYVPGPGETTFYATGQEATFGPEDTDPVRAAHCNYSIWDPWTKVDVLVFHRDGETAVPLDIASMSPPEGKATVWWDVREDVFSWERDGDPIQAPITFEGEDARVVVDPGVVFS